MSCKFFKKVMDRGAWVAQSVDPLTGSGHDLTVYESEPCVGLWADSSEQSLEPALDSVSPSLCPSPTHTPSLSLNNK